MSPTGPIRLDALRGDTPVGFLAAMGLLRLVGGTLGWGEDCVAVHHGYSDRDVLAMELVEALTGSAARFEAMPSDPKKLTRDEWLALLAAEPLWAQCLAGDEEEGIEATDLCLTAGQQKMVEVALQSGVLVDAERTAADDARERIREALFGPWRYRDRVHSLGLDPVTKQDGAFASTEPSKTPALGMAGLYWLAWHGLPAVPVVAGRAVGAEARAWVWPLSVQARGAMGWERLAKVAPAMDGAERRAMGVTLWRSAVVRSGSYGWFAPAAQVRESVVVAKRREVRARGGV